MLRIVGFKGHRPEDNFYSCIPLFCLLMLPWLNAPQKARAKRGEKTKRQLRVRITEKWKGRSYQAHSTSLGQTQQVREETEVKNLRPSQVGKEGAFPCDKLNLCWSTREIAFLKKQGPSSRHDRRQQAAGRGAAGRHSEPDDQDSK